MPRDENAVVWDAQRPEVLQLPTSVMQTLGVATAPIRKGSRSRRLELSGSLGPNTDHMTPVYPRFGGEVIEIGQVPDQEPSRSTHFRAVVTGDQVGKGQLLAVVSSADLGQKKNDLVDAILKLRTDEEQLKYLRELYAKGAVPEKQVRDAEFAVRSDRNVLAKAEMSLRSWRLEEGEINKVYADADKISERIREGKPARTEADWRQWSRVEVTSPLDGTVLEKNITVGTQVDPSKTLFIVGDLTYLSAWAYVYEEDLPVVQALPKPVEWTVYLKADQARPIRGTVSEIRPVIDPNVHAALIKGPMPNPEGKLLVGEFITAVLDIPAFPGELEIPTTALVEDGQHHVVFVLADGAKSPAERYRAFQLRPVSVVRRGEEVVQISNHGARDESLRLPPLKPGDQIVTAGALEMWAKLRDLQDSSRSKAQPQAVSGGAPGQ
jgi:cobalt-zinc-cadmium efflux system membrane fusion protein